MPTNTSVTPIPQMLKGIKVRTHCWPFHLLNVQFSQDSSGYARYMSPGIVVHEYKFRANIVCSICSMYPTAVRLPRTTTRSVRPSNTGATPPYHRTLSESVAFLDNIWHALLTTLTSIMLCQGKSGLVCE